VSFWITLTLKRFKPPPGIDPDPQGRAIDVVSHVQDRIAPCFAGAAWLKRRFPARSYLNILLLPQNDDASVSVEYLKTKGWGMGNGGPREIRCGLRIPAVWFTEAGHGLVGLRLFQAVLHALNVVGDHYGIGRPAARIPKPDPDFELWDPFGPPPPRGLPYAEINAHLERLTVSIGPDQLVLAVKEPASSTITDQCRNVHEALGLIVERHTLTAPDAKATAWIIQIPS
jgi:hypothetical protein